MPLLFKGLVSAVIIVALSELARRHALLSGLLAAMPPWAFGPLAQEVGMVCLEERAFVEDGGCRHR